MTTSELILLLHDADPDGDTEVSVDGAAAWIVYRQAAYYDGARQDIIIDPDKSGYNVIGARRTTRGHKVVIRSMSVQEAIEENPDLPIEYVGGSDKWYREEDDRARERVRRENAELEAPWPATETP